MSESIVRAGTMQIPVNQITASQLSTASFVAITDAALDMRAYKSLSVTATRATNDVDVGVYGANVSDYSDEVLVDTLQPTSGVADSYAVELAPFSYYRLKVKDTSGGSHGTASVTMLAKR